MTARVNPSSLSLPGSAEGGDALAVLVGYFRDPQGNPVSGVQMNFTADPVNPNLTMNPSSAFTNEDGGASTQVRVDVGTPEGSYVLVAYTSPASAGPNARGQAELFIGSQYENLRITTSTLGGPYESDTTASAAGCRVGYCRECNLECDRRRTALHLDLDGAAPQPDSGRQPDPRDHSLACHVCRFGNGDRLCRRHGDRLLHHHRLLGPS